MLQNTTIFICNTIIYSYLIAYILISITTIIYLLNIILRNLYMQIYLFVILHKIMLMKRVACILSLTFLSYCCVCACNKKQSKKSDKADTILPKEIQDSNSRNYSSKTINDVNVIEGYTRESNQTEFGNWIANITLKKDNTVYLFDGRVKPYQDGAYAVLDISVPDKDVQQCADALMRIRAEYLFSKKDYEGLQFKSVDGPWLGFKDYINGKRWKDVRGKLKSYTVDSLRNTTTTQLRKAFDNYLFLVFSFCNTYSLSQQLSHNSIHTSAIKTGDIFIRGGFPGHATIAVSTAKNNAGKRIAMFAQSYMPAQSIHIIINPKNGTPWFELNDNAGLSYSEYDFTKNEAKTW